MSFLRNMAPRRRPGKICPLAICLPTWQQAPPQWEGRPMRSCTPMRQNPFPPRFGNPIRTSWTWVGLRTAVNRIGSLEILAHVEPWKWTKIRKAGAGVQRLRLSCLEAAPSWENRPVAWLYACHSPRPRRRWIFRGRLASPATCVSLLLSVGGALNVRSTSPNRTAALCSH